jgi:nitrile hydratase accessory protein
MELQGLIAPPMANGEVVFDAPWQSRVFGMARALCEQGMFTWDEFREQLILQIGTGTDDEDYQYFIYFFDALTFLLEKKQMFSTDELLVLSEQLAARPHGHDHSH